MNSRRPHAGFRLSCLVRLRVGAFFIACNKCFEALPATLQESEEGTTMATQEKIAAVSELKELFEASNAVILTEYRGLTVAQLK